MTVNINPPGVIDCTKCGDELTQKKRPLCQGCVDDACADVEIDCGICGRHRAECCDDCASSGTAEKVREYAARRKSLGLMSIDAYDAIMLMASDFEALHGA